MEFQHIDSTAGEPPAELGQHFQGQAAIQRFDSPFPEGPEVFAVHFQAGGRSKPHIHASGQVLHVTSGRGIIAGDAARRVVGPGDVVTVPAGEWHWHGGAPDSPMTHLTVQMTGPGSIDWNVDEGDWSTDYGN